MKEQKPLSLIQKILLIVIISLSISISVPSYFIFNVIKENLWLNFKSRSEKIIEELKYAVYPTIDLLKIKTLVSEIKYDPNIYYFALYTEDGNLLYIYTNPYKKIQLINIPTKKELQSKKVFLRLFTYTTNGYKIKKFNIL